MTSIRGAVRLAQELSVFGSTDASLLQSSEDQTDTSTETLRIPTGIPKRFSCGKPLKVQQSSIAGVGRGFFGQTKTEEAEVIFSIEKPLLNVVHSVYYLRSRIS